MVIEERICSDGHGSIEPELLVVHSTSDPGADADTLCRYWESGQTDYQVHYCVDWLGQCYHCVPDDRKAWHCGNGNFVSIGIEICEPPEGASQDDLDASWRYAVEACSQILVAHGWGPEDMRSHHWMSEHYGGSDHTDPDEYFERLGHTWGEFVDAVAGFGGESEEAAVGEWVQDSTGWWYKLPDGFYSSCWQMIDGSWYHFDDRGYMSTGWLEDGTTHDGLPRWFWLGSDGKMASDAWEQLGGSWFWFKSDGSMAISEAMGIGESWYAFDSQGHMMTRDVPVDSGGHMDFTAK
jgi:hypothetical protein